VRLEGKICVVTGSSRGLGEAFARGYAAEGATVVVTYSEQAAAAEKVAEEIGSDLVVQLDQRDRSSVNQAFALVGEKYGRIDVLLNNAGVSFPAPLLDIEEEKLDTMLRVNIRAVVIAAKAAARIMVHQGEGVIINLSSTFGKVGRPGTSVYSGTKHFIEGFTKSTAVELASKGVRVVAVGPTAIETPMTSARLADPVAGSDLLSKIPMGRFGQVEDVVGAVVFLASPAAGFVNGVTLPVDGGYLAV